MSLPELCIRRPVFTLVISLLITIIGVICYSQLPVRWFPKIEPPVISIFTSYPGANPQLVENEITTPIEKALSHVDGIDEITSFSRLGSSQITLVFKSKQNIDVAMQDVKNSLDQVTFSLPEDAKAPLVSKADPDSRAILFMAFYDTSRTTSEISDYLEEFVFPDLETVNGVGNISEYGVKRYAVRIWLDPERMAAHNITVNDVMRILKEQNVEIPSGQIKTANRYYTVIVDEKFKNIDQFNHILLRTDMRGNVRLMDVGKTEMGTENADNAFRVDGRAAIGLGIIPISTANPLEVSADIRARLAKLSAQLPDTMQAKIVFDQTDFTRASLTSVKRTLIEAGLFVLIIVLIFLGSFRSAFIPIITIPVSLIGTFAILNALGYSVNTITLLAMVLAIGLVVDDAIVMVENISRHIENKTPPLQAAIKGSKQMIFPIIAMTITLASVYIPIGFAAGTSGQILREFAYTLAGSVLISGVVALTLSPMLCAKFLKPQAENFYQVRLHRFLNWLSETYGNSLATLLNYRYLVIIFLGLVVWAGYICYNKLAKEYVPAEDLGAVAAYIAAPKDASFAYTDAVVKELETKLKNIDGVESYLINTGYSVPNSAFAMLMLKPWQQREVNSAQVVKQLEEQIKDIPGANIYVHPFSTPLARYSDSQGNNMGLAIMTSGSYKDLFNITENIQAKFKNNPNFTYSDHDLKWDAKQFIVKIDREKAADLHIPMSNINETIQTLIAGQNITKYSFSGKEYNVIVKTNEVNLANPDVVQHLYVRNQQGMMIPLGNVATVETITSPSKLQHYGRLRSDTLSVNLAEHYSMAQAVAYLQHVAKNMLPAHTKYEFVGDAKTFLESSNTLLTAFLLGLLFIYLVLSAQFESFKDPLIILLTVPFAMIGSLITLKLTGASLNLYSQIGLITLAGLIAKHGILIVEFANQQVQNGADLYSAVINAAKLRLRPILITTGAMVLGALPLAFASGPGSETRQQIGAVIVSGLLVGTLFSLFVVPVAYVIFNSFRQPRDLATEIRN